MSSLSVNGMRNLISQVYNNKTWERKVDNMPDNQVIAIYYSFCAKGRFDEKPKKSQSEIPEKQIPIGGDFLMRVIYSGDTYNVIDITNDSYIVADDENDMISLRKELCEVA